MEEVDYKDCSHTELRFLGVQKGEYGENRYYQCMRCRAVLVLSEDEQLYIVPGVKGQPEEG